MGLKKISILLLVLAIIPLTIPSCNGAVAGSPITTPADWIDLSLSPLPKLGETAELKFASRFTSFGPKDEGDGQAWVEFSYANHKGSYSEAKYAVPISLEEVLVSGDLSWEGDVFEDGCPEMTATIQLPREGVWLIRGYFYCEGLHRYQHRFEEKLFVLVTEDAAALMNTPEFASGPFGYLANFRYGQYGEMSTPESKSGLFSCLPNFDYGGASGGRTPTEDTPVVLELDISKVPRAGEEVLLTCRIDSIIDCSDYSAKFRFGKRGDDNHITFMSGDSLLVDGDLEWSGDLKKNESVEFSATIKFPEDGDWMIQVLGDHPKYSGNFLTDTIEMNINGEIGSFGWEERRGEPTFAWE